MELQHRMMRAAVGIIINKAVHDIQNNTKRSIRNLVDLGEHFSKGKNQKHFFNLAHEVIDNPQNPYNTLVSEIIRNVEPEKIRIFGTNLGYSSFSYGVNILRLQEAELNHHIPWTILFDLQKEGELGQDRLDSIINEGRELGIYCYIFRVGGARGQADIFMSLAQKYEECSFFALVSPELIDDDFSERVCRLQNTAVSVGIQPGPEKAGLCKHAFHSLFQRHCIYGFHIYYSDETAGQVLSDRFLDFVLSCHCVFGIYINEDAQEENTEDIIFRFVSRVRGSNGRPLIAIDWYKDNLFISNSISPGSDYMTIDAKENVFFHGKKLSVCIKQMNLRETIRAVMPEI